MSVIEKLIRFSKFDLDQKRRYLRDLQEQEAIIENAIARLDEEIRSEQAFTKGATEFAPYYGGYANLAKARRVDLEDRLSKAQTEVESAREEVIKAFEELKKFEITKDNQDAARRREDKHVEQTELDEIALTSHQRRGRE